MKFIGFVFFLTCITIPICAQKWQTNLNQKLIIDSLVVGFPKNTEISIAIINKDSIHFYGLRKLDFDNFQVVENKHIVFEIGSVSKIFTSTLLIHAVKDKILQVDDFISKQSKIKYKNKAEITFKQLSNHTAGLARLPSNMFDVMIANPKNPYINYHEENLLKYLKNDFKTFSKPGEKYEYSNLGAGLLGFLLSKKYESSYENLLQQKIFQLHNMTQTTSIRSKIKNVNLVHALDVSGNEIPHWDFDVLVGAGGIYSNVSDLSKFLLANIQANQDVYTSQHKETFKINENLSIAYAWHVSKNNNQHIYWHNGATGGFRSFMGFDAIHKNGIIILTNVCPQHKNNGNIDELGFELLETLKYEN